jgi:MFS family permease
MAQSKPPYFAGLSKNTFLLALSSLFADISTEMLYPVLPIFLTQTLKASGSDIGIIEGIAQATQNITQGFSGWLSDKLQRRKPIALAGYLLAAIAKPLMGLATAWQGVLGARFLDRFGAGSRSAPRDALIASSVEPQYRGRAFGLEGFGDNLGAFLGPLLAIFLLIVKGLDMRWLFYLAIIPGLLAFLMVLFVKEPASATTTTSTTKIVTHFRLYPTAYWKYLLAIAVFGIGNSSNSFLILQTKSLGASLTVTILIYAAFNLIAALTSYPAGTLSDRLGRKNLLLIGFIIFFVTYLGFALTHKLALIAILFVLYGMFQGVFRAVGKALATDLVPQTLRASGIGWYSATVGLLQLIASIVAGVLWDKVSHNAVFLYGAIFALIGTIALLLLVQDKSTVAPGRSLAEAPEHQS